MKNIEIKQNALVRFCIDFLPLLGFLVIYYTYGLMPGTFTLIILSLFALIVSLIAEKKIPYMPLLTAAIVGIFGGLTLWFNDERFIKMKPTIINLILGASLWGALLFNKYPLKKLLGTAIQMPDIGWRILSKRWAIFFVALAILNEFVWRNSSTTTWVNFKVFGLLFLTVVFVIFQSRLIQKYQKG